MARSGINIRIYLAAGFGEECSSTAEEIVPVIESGAKF